MPRVASGIRHQQENEVDDAPSDENESRGNLYRLIHRADRHSSVHMHLLLASLLGTKSARSADWRDEAVETLSTHLSEENMRAEADVLRNNPSRERPYGWAWAVDLNRVLNANENSELRTLGKHAQVLADTVFDLVLERLPKVPEPVRHGVHSNTAFALRRILIGARTQDRSDVVDTIAEAARRFYARDQAWNFRQERSGHDFLSPGLCEADVMAEVLTEDELAVVVAGLLVGTDPGITRAHTCRGPRPHRRAAEPPLRIGAPCRRVADASGTEVALHPPSTRAIDEVGDHARGHLTPVDDLMAPGFEAAVSDQYMASHWVATFAWEALVLRNH